MVAFMVVISVALVIGQGQPLAENVVRLRLTDCAPPCWIGIRPGLTTEGRAQRLFSAMYPQQKPYVIQPDSVGGGLQMDTGLYAPSPSDLVGHVLIYDADRKTGVGVVNSVLMPRLGDVMPLWGLPTCMYYEPPDFWRLHYNTGSDGLSVIDILMKGSRLSPGQPIYFLIFYHTSREFGTRCQREDARQWGGFANTR